MNKDKITEAILLCTIVTISCVFYVDQDGKYGHNCFQLEKIQKTVITYSEIVFMTLEIFFLTPYVFL